MLNDTSSYGYGLFTRDEVISSSSCVVNMQAMQGWIKLINNKLYAGSYDASTGNKIVAKVYAR